MTDTEAQAPELLPCPFCGSRGIDRELSRLRPYPYCTNCGANGPIHKAEWNRRAHYPRAAFGGEATQAQVRVRDLVWEGNVSSLEIPCSYWLDGDDEDGWEVKTTWRTGTDDLDDGLKYSTLDEAKAAAQADYTARILAAIEVTP